MIQIYSDPHQGLNLASNTTPASRKALREFIALNTATVIDDFDDSDIILCAGDFYHTYKNSEEDIYSSMWSASKTSKILTGNHDVVNIRGAKGSLDLIASMFDSHVVPCRFGKVSYQVLPATFPPTPNHSIYMVPHHSNQELFVEALDAVAESAKTCDKAILVTHCNYDSPFIKDDVTLNMSSRKAQELLKSFEYIFLGHEHNPRTDHDDRVIVVGSPHPTGFGDISDKYIVTIDEQFNTPIRKQVWSKSKHYLECDYSELPELLTADHQWVKLTGTVVPSQIHELASTIRLGWKLFSPFAIKSEVEILTGDSFATSQTESTVERINEIIEMELKNSPELYKLWRQINDSQSAS